MTFNELPPDWRHRPLTDPALTADVVDLYCTAGDRSRGAITLIICNEHNHFKGAIAINLCDLIPDPTTPRAPAATNSPRTPAIASSPRAIAANTSPRPHAAPSSARSATLPDSARSAAAPSSTRASDASGSRSTTPRSISRAAALRPVIRPLQVFPGGALILALGRCGPSETTTSDREWAEAAVRVCRSLGVRLLGFYLASRDTVFQADLTTAVTDLPTAA